MKITTETFELPERPGRGECGKAHRIFRREVLQLFALLLGVYRLRPQDIAGLLGVSLRAIRTWQRRRKLKTSLLPRSRKPKSVRVSIIRDAALRDAIVSLWRADDFTNNATLLHDVLALGYQLSMATLKRALKDLREEGRITFRLAGKHRKQCRGNRKKAQPARIKAAEEYQRAMPAQLAPGARIQMDTVFARCCNKQMPVIIAVDVATRLVWYREVHALTSSAAAALLREVCADPLLPHGVGMVQTDCGNEFLGQCASACAELSVARMVNPPGNPKCNAFVESFNNTLRRECLNRLPHNVSAAQLRRALAAYIAAYNNKRRHSGLGGISPIMALKRLSS